MPTNSSVVGPDNGWAKPFPTFHDFPPVDIELSGIGYRTTSPFPPLDPSAMKITYPFTAFGAPLVSTTVHAATPQNPGNGIIIAGGGAVYSFDPDASNAVSTLRLEGWGFCNDYGVDSIPLVPTCSL